MLPDGENPLADLSLTQCTLPASNFTVT